MQRQDALHELELQDHLGVHDDVGEVAAVQVGVVIQDGEGDVAFERQGCPWRNAWQRQAS